MSKQILKETLNIPDDTLRLIARTWNVNTVKLAKYNGIKNPDLIEVGQIIYNPAYKRNRVK